MSRFPDRPPPNDGYQYIWISTREGGYWRKKRGSLTPIVLNSTFSKNAKLTSIVSEAARQIQLRLKPFIHDLDTGRFIARISGRLKKAWNKSGYFHYSFMENYEIQPHRKLAWVFPKAPDAYIDKNEVVYIIPFKGHAMNHMTKEISGYFFEMILITGDPSKPKKLRVQSETSPNYFFNSPPPDICELRLFLPENNIPWMALIKASSLDKNGKPSKGKVSSGMKVVKTNPIVNRET